MSMHENFTIYLLKKTVYGMEHCIWDVTIVTDIGSRSSLNSPALPHLGGGGRSLALCFHRDCLDR